METILQLFGIDSSSVFLVLRISLRHGLMKLLRPKSNKSIL